MELTGNLYDIFREITDINEFIKVYPFEKVKEYYDKKNKEIDYKYFVCLLEKDFNYAIMYYQNNNEFMHELMKVSSSIYSMFGYANSNSIEIIFRYLNNHKEDYDLFKSINNFDSNELYKYVSSSNDNELICRLLNGSFWLYKKFVMQDERAIYFINNHMIDIRIVEYPDYLKENNNIFESLKDYSIAQTRENINKYSELNKIYSIQEKFEKYEDRLINKFNPDTKDFDNEEIDNYLQTYSLLGFEKIENERKFNELIIDRLFRDNYNNVIINIKEVLRYASKSNVVSFDNIELYNRIINFKDLSYEEKMDIYNKYKDQKLYTKFYLDILNCKKDLYQKIKDSLYIPKEIDKELSDKYNTNIYYLNGEDFSMLVRVLDDRYSTIRKQERECFSLINSDNTSKFEGDYVYGYNDFDTERIISINEYDAFSSKDGETDFPNRLMTIDELASKKNYNEVQIQTNNTSLIPSYVVAFNEIKDDDVYESQRLGIPLILINEEAYNKKDLSGNMFGSRERYVDGSNYEYRGHTL